MRWLVVVGALALSACDGRVGAEVHCYEETPGGPLVAGCFEGERLLGSADGIYAARCGDPATQWECDEAGCFETPLTRNVLCDTGEPRCADSGEGVPGVTSWGVFCLETPE